MKRSESVLMYGVTGILLVILAVAVIFGSESKAVESAQPAKIDGGGNSGIFPEDLVEPPFDDGDGKKPGGAEGPGGTDPVDPAPAELDLVPGPASAQVALSYGQSRVERSALGESEVTNHGELYRFITVRQNDTFDLLVERWTGSVANRDDVMAMNEDLRVHPLQPHSRICMPYVADELLMSAMDDRRRARASRSFSESERTSGDESGSVPLRAKSSSAVAREVVLKKGESLWTIAAREVGRRHADAYIKRICALNGIDDPGRVQEKQKIKLPAKKTE